MKIPEPFSQLLRGDEKLSSCILQIISDFQPILKDNKLYFFEEYTNHGIEHIESVLNAAAEIITEDSYALLSAKDVGILIMSIILHDLGMHIEYSTFLAFINGEYDEVRVESLDRKSWKRLWEEYLNEAKRFSSKQRYLYFGNENQPFKEPNLLNKDTLDGADKKLIGEFVRRFHTRFAHEVALKGLVGKEGEIIEFGGDRLDDLDKKLAGIVARSHGMNIRATFPYLREISGDAWKNPNKVNVTFLMVVLRIADYFQFDNERVDKMLLKLKTFMSPVSRTEHDKHLAVKFVQTHFDDVERLYVYAQPETSNLFVKLNDLLKDIQHELDMSWAVLGEIYSRSPEEQRPMIKYRRISSNLEDESFYSGLPYVPEKISFQTDVELPKLLIAPLYGNNPTFGVRELIQNSVDACLERNIDEIKMDTHYVPEINLEITKPSEDRFEFVIKDNGKGMSLYEIMSYFLKVGSSFRKSLDWKKKYTDEKGSSLVNRNGKFGIGILAAFLLGNVIEVKTKHFKERFGYSFTASIDTDQIEIRINKTDAVNGTTIRIQISEDTLLSLGKVKNTHGNSIPLWTGWYLLSFPRITYKYLDKDVSDHYLSLRYRNVDSYNWHAIYPENFERVTWKYCDPSPYRSIYRKENLLCNGILIPNEPTSKNQTVTTNCEVIREMPTLLISDNEGNLPLTLNRNELDGELPFIEDLVRDLSKDFIARILLLGIDPFSDAAEKIDFVPNSADIAFLRDGFTFRIDYFWDVLKRQDYKLMECMDRRDILNFHANELDQKVALVHTTDTNTSIPTLLQLIDPSEKSGFVLKSKRFESLFNAQDSRIGNFANSIRPNGEIRFYDEGFVFYTINMRQSEFETFVKLFDEDFFRTPSIIRMTELDAISTRKSGGILNELLQTYIGQNVIIPYDLEQRVKLYPLAFEELKEYQKKYQE